MKNFVFIFIYMIYSCSVNSQESKYFKISYESSSNFPVANQMKSNSIIRVDYLKDKVTLDIILNDSICSSESFEIKKDTILGNWYSIQDYTHRLLFPELNMKISKKKEGLNETGIMEARENEKWTITKEWGIGLTSSISGKIEIDGNTTILKTTSSINTPARPFSGTSVTVIKEMKGFEILKFDQKWEDCM